MYEGETLSVEAAEAVMSGLVCLYGIEGLDWVRHRLGWFYINLS